MDDFARAKGHVNYILMIKVGQIWNQLPWVLAGLSHMNEDTARSCACRIIQMYDSAPDEESLHHRLSTKFCSRGGDLRKSLDEFAAGASREELPIDFRIQVAKLCFVPCTERCIEAPHAKVMKSIAHRRHGPLSVSMSLR